jgi:hypothetical protein
LAHQVFKKVEQWSCIFNEGKNFKSVHERFNNSICPELALLIAEYHTATCVLKYLLISVQPSRTHLFGELLSTFQGFEKYYTKPEVDKLTSRVIFVIIPLARIRNSTRKNRSFGA